ncbi:MAG TPA: PQQ-binding-like beta-propeller repeat protein [Thermoanaerobaculia bacterium]|nr:PQQ-binding-like beta-propeller repeat protein [Thermoanaerobaculia bacterium]
MRRKAPTRLALAASCLFVTVAFASDWPQWRGPLANGVAPQGNPPIAWSETQNVRFKIAIPGRGLSTPVVWKSKIFVTSAVPVGEAPAPAPAPAEGGRPGRVVPSGAQRFVLHLIDTSTGEILWTRTAREAVPHEGTHADGSWASASPVTDGEVVLAHFGSNGLYAYDLDGKLLWSKDLGDMAARNAFGEGSSPVIAGDTVVVNWDHEAGSFIVALDKRTGNERWRQSREEVTSWSTPLVVEHGGRKQVVVAATGRTRAYDLATGEVIWQVGGLTTNVIPSPVESDGVVYLMSGFRGNALQAIRLDQAKGEVAGAPAVAWTWDRDTPYVPSPLLYEGILYFLKHNTGTLSALDAKTGALRYGPVRLEGLDGAYASPVAAAGRVYVVGRNGVTQVIKAGAEHVVLATNKLDDRFDASPVIAGNQLLLRGHRYLYALAAPAGK